MVPTTQGREAGPQTAAFGVIPSTQSDASLCPTQGQLRAKDTARLTLEPPLTLPPGSPTCMARLTR